MAELNLLRWDKVLPILSNRGRLCSHLVPYGRRLLAPVKAPSLLLEFDLRRIATFFDPPIGGK